MESTIKIGDTMDVIAFGVPIADVIIEINSLPIRAADWLHATRTFLYPGGVSNVVVGCSRLGMDACIIGAEARD